MIFAILTLTCALAAQEPEIQQTPVEAEASVQELEYASIVSELVGNEIHYEILDLRFSDGARHVRADRAFIRLAQEEYAATLDGSRILGDLALEILGRPGQPVEQAIVLELRLQGNVLVEGAEGTLQCRWLAHQPPLGVATFYEAELTVRNDLGPRGWPWRLRAQYLQEFPDGSLRARGAQLTACHLDDPSYALAMRDLRGTPDGKGDYIWEPTSPWIEVGNRRILPMPAFDFRTGEEDGGFGLRSLRISSSRQLGTAIELGFAASANFAEGKLDWRLYPSVSTRRGFPLRSTLKYRSDVYTADWDFFVLQDGAEDIHPLRSRVARDTDLRWRIRLDNRFDLSELWRLDFDVALTSDPLVDPEFFRREWVSEDDAQTELYLRRNSSDSHFAVRTTLRLDDAGFVPLIAYGERGSTETQQLELLPRVTFESFSRSIAQIPVGAFGGNDRQSSLNLSWGLDAGRFRLRSLGVEAPTGSIPFVPLASETRDRAMLWSELELPMSLGPLALRPGVRAEAGAVNDASGTGSDAQSSIEAFIETSVAFERSYANGWLHRVRPMIRLRDLHMIDERGPEWYPFEAFDRRVDGQAIELSLRQLWYGPNRHRPWLDVNLLVPYYLDPDEALVDGSFVGLRSSEARRAWGPAELRSIWDPGVRSGLLRGIRTTSNLRYRMDSDHLEEWFTQISLAPQANWRFSLAQRLFAQEEVPELAFRSTGFTLDWRINDTFEMTAGRTFSARGNSTTNTRYGLTYYGHGFAFEFYAARNDQTGESRYGVNLVPCFLVEKFQDYDPGPLPLRRGLE